MSFIEDCKVLLKTNHKFYQRPPLVEVRVPTVSSVLLSEVRAVICYQEELARTLTVAVEKLASVLEQAEAQFNAGDSHASYNKEFMKALNMRVWGGDNIVT